MGNSIFLDLKLRDFFTTGLRNVAGKSAQAFSAVDGHINTTQKKLKGLENPIKFNVDSKGVEHASHEVDKLKSKLNSLHSGGRGLSPAGGGNIGFGTVAGGAFVGSAAYNIAQRGLQAASNQFGDVLTLGKQAGLMKTGFEVMAGLEQGGKLYGDLTTFIKETIFGTSIYGNAKTLLAYGEAANKVMPDLKMFGDIAMGDAEKMNSLTTAFGQTLSAGKLVGDDLRQYIAVGFNPLKEIERTTGIKYPRLRKMSENGLITSDMVRNAFVTATSPGGTFNGMLDKIALTPYGKEEAMRGNIEVAKMQFGESLMKSYSSVLDAMKPLSDQLPGTLAKMKPDIEKMATGLANNIKWIGENTEAIKELITWTKWLGAAYIGGKVLGIAGSSVSAFMGGAGLATGAGLGMAGGTGLAASLGGGAGILEAVTGLSIGAVGGITAIAAASAWTAWQLWDEAAKMRKAQSSGVVNQNPVRSTNPGYSPAPNVPMDVGISWDDPNAWWTKRGGKPSKTMNGGSNAGKGLDLSGGSRAGAYDGLNDVSDAITGGGQKTINITFDSFVREMHNSFASVKDGVDFTEREFKSMLARVLTGVPLAG